MYEQCLMLRPHMRTSSLQAGRDGGTPCTTFCRVPPTPTAARCPSRCLCPNCTSTPGGEQVMRQRMARACPRPRGRPGRGTANPIHTVNTAKPFTVRGATAVG